MVVLSVFPYSNDVMHEVWVGDMGYIMVVFGARWGAIFGEQLL